MKGVNDPGLDALLFKLVNQRIAHTCQRKFNKSNIISKASPALDIGRLVCNKNTGKIYISLVNTISDTFN